MFKSSRRLLLLAGCALCTLFIAGSTAWSPPAAHGQQPQDRRVTATPNVINVIAGNPGLSFSPAQLQLINLGRIVLVPPTTSGGCIKHLRYQKNDKDLQQVTFDDGTWITRDPASSPNMQILNLNAFRERLQEAANFGHAVGFCVRIPKKEMFMLNIYPCRCKCDKR